MRYTHQEFGEKPRGFRIKSKRVGKHVLRLAFPKGPRKKGSGVAVSLLHPRSENPNLCNLAKKNPAELVLLGNPRPIVTGFRNRGAYGSGIEWSFDADGQSQSFVAPKGTPKAQIRRMALREAEARRRLVPRLHHLLTGNPTISEKVEQRKTEIQRAKQVEETRKGSRPVGNPLVSSEAVETYRDFHGRDPREIIAFQQSAEERGEFSALGDLVSITGRTPNGSTFQIKSDTIKLASNPERTQLYLLGDQDISSMLDRLDTDTSKDFIEIGEARWIEYFARKEQDGYQGARYEHKLGEETGESPILFYDAIKRRLFFVGGRYQIESRGIVN